MSDWPQKEPLFSLETTGPQGMVGIEQWFEVAQQMPGALPPATLEILDGAVEVTRAFNKIDTEGRAPADDLMIINIASSNDGMIIYLLAASKERRIVVRNNPQVQYGINLLGSDDKVLSAERPLMLRREGEVWFELSAADDQEEVGADSAGIVPAFGSAPQNAIVRRDPQNGGAPAWGADQIPVSIAGGFDFNTKTEPLYAYLNSTNLSEYSNHPPCFIGSSLALGFLQVQSYKDSGGFLRVIQRYTVWQHTGTYQGLQYTRALHGDPGIWSEWQHNGWQPDYSMAVTRSVPTQDSVFTMPYSGYVIARLAADVNAGRETYLYINRGGTNELVAYIYWNGNYTVENVFTVPVRQGDGVWAQGSGVKMFKTIPCLGEQA